jgi:hypothetical protein
LKKRQIALNQFSKFGELSSTSRGGIFVPDRNSIYSL